MEGLTPQRLTPSLVAPDPEFGLHNPGSRAVPGERPCPGAHRGEGVVPNQVWPDSGSVPFPMEDPTHGTATPCLQSEDQKSEEKVSLREWSTGAVAVFCSWRWPVRESSHGSPWSCSA